MWIPVNQNEYFKLWGEKAEKLVCIKKHDEISSPNEQGHCTIINMTTMWGYKDTRKPFIMFQIIAEKAYFFQWSD